MHYNFAEDTNLLTLNSNAGIANENDETCVLLTTKRLKYMPSFTSHQ